MKIKVVKSAVESDLNKSINGRKILKCKLIGEKLKSTQIKRPNLNVN
jgi:hypothetical protein